MDSSLPISRNWCRRRESAEAPAHKIKKGICKTISFVSGLSYRSLTYICIFLRKVRNIVNCTSIEGNKTVHTFLLLNNKIILYTCVSSWIISSVYLSTMLRHSLCTGALHSSISVWYVDTKCIAFSYPPPPIVRPCTEKLVSLTAIICEAHSPDPFSLTTSSYFGALVT